MGGAAERRDGDLFGVADGVTAMADDTTSLYIGGVSPAEVGVPEGGENNDEASG